MAPRHGCSGDRWSARASPSGSSIISRGERAIPADHRLPIQHPIVEGRLHPPALGILGDHLATDPAPEAIETVRVSTLVANPAHLAGLGGTLDVPDHVVGAIWSKRVTSLLAPAVLSAWSLHDIGIEVSAANIEIREGQTQPERCWIVDPSAFEEGRPARRRGPASLFGACLAPLFQAVEEATGAPSEVQWSNVANLVVYLYDRFEEHGLAGETQRRDRARLLETGELVGLEGSNPLRGTVSYEELGEPAPVDRYAVREVCCLKRHVPGENPCASCPTLTREQRATLVAQRRA